MNYSMPLMNGSPASPSLYAELPRYFSKHEKFALATVLETTGSSPQKKGNSALFGKRGLIAGTIGGGIVEFSIQQIAKEAITGKTASLHSFNLTNDISEQDAAICGGKMKILLDVNPRKHLAVFNAVKNSLLNRISGVMILYFYARKKDEYIIEREWISNKDLNNFSFSLAPKIRKQVEDMLANPVHRDFSKIESPDVSGKKELTIYLEMIVPPPRLIIAGAGHIGKALSSLGKMLGFEVIVWDYRSQYTTKENLPDADLILNGSIETSLAKVSVDKNTFIVTVTTGHNNDSEVLKTFLKSPAGYLGMIGSRKKNILMREQFIKQGWATAKEWEKIYSPVGLDINSETIEEIAVSIAAQLIQVRHQINSKK